MTHWAMVRRGSYLPRLVKVLALLILLALPLLAGSPRVHAAGIVVTTTTDEFDTLPIVGAGCSLREAIQAANTNTAFGGCTTGSSGLDTITFDPTVFPPSGPQKTILLDFQGPPTNPPNNHGVLLPYIVGNLDITGPGADVLTVDASPLPTTAFVIGAGVTATISRLTVTGTPDHPILNYSGTLTLKNSTVRGNYYGIENADCGTMTIENSTVSGTTDGPGILNVSAPQPYCLVNGSYRPATMTVLNSTISGNSNSGTTFGGGLSNGCPSSYSPCYQDNNATMTVLKAPSAVTAASAASRSSAAR